MSIKNRLSVREMKLYSMLVRHAGENLSVNDIALEFFGSDLPMDAVPSINALIRSINSKVGEKIKRTTPIGRGHVAHYMPVIPDKIAEEVDGL